MKLLTASEAISALLARKGSSQSSTRITPGLVVGADEAGPLSVGIVLHLAAAFGAGPPHAELGPEVPLVQV